MSKISFGLLLLATIFSVTAYIVIQDQHSYQNASCIQSFQDFAYEGPGRRNFEDILPLPPWQFEAEMPPHPYEEYEEHISHLDVALERTVDGQQEIWLTGFIFGKDWFSTPAKSIIIIYQRDTQQWEFISTDIGDTGLLVGDLLVHLFVSEDGTIWGNTEWDSMRGHPNVQSVPVLSRFNESTRRFELAQGAPEIPLILGEYSYSKPQIRLDNQDIFWIFTDNDGIYHYDPVAEANERYTDLSELDVMDTALSPDGSIYFSSFRPEAPIPIRLSDIALFQFFPKTREVKPVSLPLDAENWPDFAGLLVDHTGRLWVGSVGYRDAQGSWHLRHSNIHLRFDTPGQYIYASPQPVIESSDGMLWFRKYLDTGGWGEGTAWYNPETNVGCLITNQQSNVIEDSQHVLWLVADGKLYKYPLNP